MNDCTWMPSQQAAVLANFTARMSVALLTCGSLSYHSSLDTSFVQGRVTMLQSIRIGIGTCLGWPFDHVNCTRRVLVTVLLLK